MSERDRAARMGHHRDYWSARLPGAPPWNAWSKFFTHRRERALARQVERRARLESEEYKDWVCKSCDTFVEPNENYCGRCSRYWQDVADGIFDDWPDSSPPQRSEVG